MYEIGRTSFSYRNQCGTAVKLSVSNGNALIDKTGKEVSG